MRTPQLTSMPIHASTCRPSGGNELLCAPDCLSSTTKRGQVTIRKHPQVMDLDCRIDHCGELLKRGAILGTMALIPRLAPSDVRGRSATCYPVYGSPR